MIGRLATLLVFILVGAAALRASFQFGWVEHALWWDSLAVAMPLVVLSLWTLVRRQPAAEERARSAYRPWHAPRSGPGAAGSEALSHPE